VLRALGRSVQAAQSSLRFSLGRLTTRADIASAIAAVKREVLRLRELSPASGEASPCDDAGTGIAKGEAGSPDREAWIRFHLQTEGDAVKSARFQAYGCPHTLAATAWVAERLAGRRRDELVPGTPHEWAEALNVPVEKLGRLLIVEDALLDCLQHWPQRP
jgi:NifU-like protein involved in Fe-S cluster formation